MAPVASHPFLYFVIQYLQGQGIKRFVFSLGYKHEVVEAYLESELVDLDYRCVVETRPLQTGGAIKLALEQCKDDNVLVMNGDTLFSVDLSLLYTSHIESKSECTLALKPMNKFDRYGAVLVRPDGRINSFEEKKYVESGNINGGMYLLNKDAFLVEPWPEVFSFEIDYLTLYSQSKKFYGNIQDAYFIDIGIPEDFEKAQLELKQFSFPFSEIDKTWTLFLDRDGVINVNKDESYVFTREEFVFKEGTLEAMPFLNEKFNRIIVVTNQRGIGRGMMTTEALDDIHDYMRESIFDAGGNIDDVFYCPAVNNDHPDRKPNPGMGMKAKETYPDIDFSKSIVVGDKASDMKLGRNLGAKTVLISSNTYLGSVDLNDVDLVCSNLLEFVHLTKG